MHTKRCEHLVSSEERLLLPASAWLWLQKVPVPNAGACVRPRPYSSACIRVCLAFQTKILPKPYILGIIRAENPGAKKF